MVDLASGSLDISLIRAINWRPLLLCILSVSFCLNGFSPIISEKLSNFGQFSRFFPLNFGDYKGRIFAGSKQSWKWKILSNILTILRNGGHGSSIFPGQFNNDLGKSFEDETNDGIWDLLFLFYSTDWTKIRNDCNLFFWKKVKKVKKEAFWIS